MFITSQWKDLTSLERSDKFNSLSLISISLFSFFSLSPFFSLSLLSFSLSLSLYIYFHIFSLSISLFRNFFYTLLFSFSFSIPLFSLYFSHFLPLSLCPAISLYRFSVFLSFFMLSLPRWHRSKAWFKIIKLHISFRLHFFIYFYKMNKFIHL